jgi:hypothetical protein
LGTTEQPLLQRSHDTASRSFSLRDSQERYYELVGVLLLLFGIFLRVSAYLANRSLWGDEVCIALNLRFRGFLGLFHVLDYEQTMPTPLLLCLRLMTKLFGFSEYVLRFPLLVVGCILLLVIWKTFDRELGHSIGLLSLGLAAIYKPLIYYSAEVKQYGLDALVGTITLWFGLRFIRQESDRSLRWLLLWGLVAMVLSQPVVFLLSAVGLAALLDGQTLKSRRRVLALILVIVAWLAVFGCLYFLFYRPVSSSEYMRAFWSSSFLHPGAPHFGQALSKAIYVLLGSGNFLYLRSFVLFALFVVGVYGIAKRSELKFAVLAVVPFVVVLSAACLRLYPIATRLLLFSTPFLFWIYSSALKTVADLCPEKMRSAGLVILAALMFGPTIISSTKYSLHFPVREGTRQMVSVMRRTDRDANVYLPFGKYLQWAYYTGDWKQPNALKAKIDSDFALMRAVQIRYLRHEVDAKPCDPFFGSPVSMQPSEIIGCPAPGPSDGIEKEQEWATTESQKIFSLEKPRVWLFLPIYNDNENGGYVKQRRLLERLQSELERRGARLLNSYAVGDSTAFRYQLAPDGEVLRSNVRQDR